MSTLRLKNFTTICFTLVSLMPTFLLAATVSQQAFDDQVKTLYQNISAKKMSARINAISARFSGKPYVLGALGEGSEGRFDQFPLYRMDAFDCETYVTTVLALALADNKASGFKRCLRKLRYKNAIPEYILRNHFTSLDWNQNNQKQGFLKDITTEIRDKDDRPVVNIASALIDKPSWYQHHTLKNIRLLNSNEQEQEKRLLELKKRGSSLGKTVANIPYIPLTALFDEQGNANTALFSQIPDAAIVEIVRPNWDLTKVAGTHLNVSHLGFVFWKNGEAVFRQASSTEGKIVDVSLVDYLKATRSSPTIKGINVQIVLPEKPLADDCRIATAH